MKIKSSVQGFVLLLVLVYLQILSQFALQSLLSVAYLNKKIRQEWQMREEWVLARHILQDLEAKLSNGNLNCLFPVSASQFLLKQPSEWWKKRACAGNLNGVQYYYVQERLAAFDGLVFYRLTLFMPPVGIERAHIVLQGVTSSKE